MRVVILAAPLGLHKWTDRTCRKAFFIKTMLPSENYDYSGNAKNCLSATTCPTSIGIISCGSAKGSNIEGLLGKADALMYEQKRAKAFARRDAGDAQA